MPRSSRNSSFWTRKLELELIRYVRQKEAIWKPAGNTNHDIQLKYKAYAEFAAKLGTGFTARSVRDRWVNIRSTFNHNLRKVKRTTQTASSLNEVYVPCWPLWKPLQFLRDDVKVELESSDYLPFEILGIKKESETDMESDQLNVRTDRPRHKKTIKPRTSSKCIKVIDNLIEALNPLLKSTPKPMYWFFGKHVAERLDCMRPQDAQCASQEILRLVDNWRQGHVDPQCASQDIMALVSDWKQIDDIT